MILIKRKEAIKQLKTQDPKKLENILYEAGLVSIDLALDPGRFEQEKLQRFLHYYDSVLNNTDDIFKVSDTASKKSVIKYQEPPSFGPKSIPEPVYAEPTTLPEPIILPEPTTLPEEDYLDHLKKEPVAPVKSSEYKKPITNQSDLLKALGVNATENLSGLEKEGLYKPQNNPIEAKEDAPVTQAKPLEIQIKELEEIRDNCDKNKTRENIPGGDTYICKSEEMYKNCACKGQRFNNPRWYPLCNLEIIYSQMKQAKK